jgi:hypothetical protein
VKKCENFWEHFYEKTFLLCLDSDDGIRHLLILSCKFLITENIGI